MTGGGVSVKTKTHGNAAQTQGRPVLWLPSSWGGFSCLRPLFGALLLIQEDFCPLCASPILDDTKFSRAVVGWRRITVLVSNVFDVVDPQGFGAEGPNAIHHDLPRPCYGPVTRPFACPTSCSFERMNNGTLAHQRRRVVLYDDISTAGGPEIQPAEARMGSQPPPRAAVERYRMFVLWV